MTARQFGQLVIDDSTVGVPGDGLPAMLTNVDEVFERVRTDEFGRYRPLPGARTLPAGWQVALGNGFAAEEVIEVVYPLALTHQRQFAAGSLRVVSLEDVLARQSGRYEETSGLSADGRERSVRVVCGECVRVPVWAGADCAMGDIPCPEPCSVLVAFCREAAAWQSSRPPVTAADRTIPWAAFEEPGNELRERYLQELYSADE